MIQKQFSGVMAAGENILEGFAAVRIGIQAPPGSKFKIGSSEITMDASGIMEYRGCYATELSFLEETEAIVDVVVEEFKGV